MKFIKFTGIIIFLYMLSFTTFNAEEQTITEESAVKSAISGNLNLAAEKINLVIKERNNNAKFNVLYPRISATGSLNHMNVTQLSFNFPGFPPAKQNIISTQFNVSLSLSMQSLYNIRQLKIDLDAGKITFEKAEKMLVKEVRKNFYNLILMEENIKLIEKNIQAAKTRYDYAVINNKNGLVDQYTLLAAQVDYENIKPVIDELKNAYKTAMLSFKILINIPLDKEIKLSGSLEEVKPFPLNVEKLLSNYMNNRLDIQSLKFSLMAMENTHKIAMASLLPVLTLSYTADPGYQKDAFDSGWFDFNNNWKQTNGMIGLSMTMNFDPYIPFSKTQVEIANTKSNTEKMKLLFDQSVLNAELEIRSLVSNLGKSTESLKNMGLNVELAEKANQIGQEAYKSGTKDYSQIETTEYALHSAQFNLLKEKFNYISGLYDLAYALNSTVDDIKKMNNE